MKTGGISIAVMAMLVPCAFAAQSSTADDSADRLFQAGQFVRAAEQYAQLVAANPDDYLAVLGLGRIALLSNKFKDAEKYLEQAIALRPSETDPKVMLAQTFYRQDKFEQAAASLDGIDVSTNVLIKEQYPTLNVAQLQSFAGQTPYEVHGGQTVHVRFLQTDPLPLISVRVNGGQEVTFFIDTGASVVTLDSDFAKELGIPQFGSTQGTFAGGQTAEVTAGRIESLTLGSWTVKNLPVATLPLRQINLGPTRIDGVIGTTLFYHFLATMDYRHGELVLRKKNAKSHRAFAEESDDRVAVPFWVASDHFMVALGRVETLPPTQLFIDTGLADAGVKLAESVIKQGGITLEEDKATIGQGAGNGTLTIVPYTVHHVSLGAIQEENVRGLFDGPFPWENTFGFHLAGMVGHEFFRPYAVTFDFTNMEIDLEKGSK